MASVLSTEEIASLRASATSQLCDTATRTTYTRTTDAIGGYTQTAVTPTTAVVCRIVQAQRSKGKAVAIGLEQRPQVVCAYGTGLSVGDNLLINGVNYRVGLTIDRGANAVDERHEIEAL